MAVLAVAPVATLDLKSMMSESTYIHKERERVRRTPTHPERCVCNKTREARRVSRTIRVGTSNRP